MAQLLRFNTALRPIAASPLSLASACDATRQLTTQRDADTNHANNPRWLSDLKHRLQNLQKPERPPLQVQKAKELANHLHENWIELLGGGEGYLTAKEWRGLDQHRVAWGDMDSMVSHVNNVMYNRYAESSRVNWTRNFASHSGPEHRQEWLDLLTPRGIGLILRSIKTDYKFPMDYPDRTTVLHKLSSPPKYDSDHILLEAVILSERQQRVAARCFEDTVIFDYRIGKKSTMKKFMVDALGKIYEEQEVNKQKCVGEINDLVGRVEEIEAAVV